MKKLLLLFFLLTSFLFSQRYYVPVPITSSSGRPIQNATVVIYLTGTTTSGITMTWEDAGRYYYTGGASTVANGAYDIYVNGYLWMSNVYFGNNDSAALTTLFRGDIEDSILNNNEVAYLESYGAVGDGSTDDSTAFVTALATGKKILGVGGKTYRINVDTSLTFTGTDIHIESNSADPITLEFPNEIESYALRFLGTIHDSSTTVEGGLNLGVDSVLLDTAYFIEKGDLIAFASDSSWYHISGYKYEIHYVDTVKGDWVFLREGVQDVYESTETVTVRKYDPIRVTLKNVKIKTPNGSTSTRGIFGQFLYDFELDRVYVDEADREGIGIYQSYLGKINDCVVISADLSGTGYGIYINGCYDILIDKAYTYDCRSGFDGGGYVSRNVKILNSFFHCGNKSTSTYRGAGVHENFENVLFDNCTFEGGYSGLNLRGSNVKVVNCDFINNQQYGIEVLSGHNYEIIHNTFDNLTSKRPSLSSPPLDSTFTRFGIALYGSSLDTTTANRYIIRDNVFKSLERSAVYLTHDINNLIFDNNVVWFNNYLNTELNLVYSASNVITISNSSFRDNETRNLSTGTYQMFSDNITVSYTSTPVHYWNSDGDYISEEKQEPATLEASNLVISDAAPSTPILGSMYYVQGRQTEPDTLKTYTGSQWLNFVSTDTNAITNYVAEFDSATALSLATDVARDSTQAWTFEVWLKENQDATLVSATVFDDAALAYCQFDFPASNASAVSHIDSSYVYGLADAYTLDYTSSTFENGWIHVAAWYNGVDTAQIIIYDNDNNTEYVETETPVDHFHLYIDQIAAKTASTTNYYKGWMDELRVWTDVRTRTEISENRKTELAGSEGGLLYYWKFDKTLTSDATANTLTEDEGTVTYDSLDVPFHQ